MAFCLNVRRVEQPSIEGQDLIDGIVRLSFERAAELGGKNYSDAIDGSADFVLMFVPADPIIDAAMKVQPTLWEQAWRKHKVLIATPGTLMAFLRTVALAWQQPEMAENAQQIADLGKNLFDRLRTFAERLQEMGDGLDKAVDAKNTGVNSSGSE